MFSIKCMPPLDGGVAAVAIYPVLLCFQKCNFLPHQFFLRAGNRPTAALGIIPPQSKPTQLLCARRPSDKLVLSTRVRTEQQKEERGEQEDEKEKAGKEISAKNSCVRAVEFSNGRRGPMAVSAVRGSHTARDTEGQRPKEKELL